jgi:chemotaxis family two-component system sensor histidine kinase/response regulator PixL
MVNLASGKAAYQFFIEEAPDLLQAIESGLLTLRQERTPAKVHEIMRSAHSLKGGAASAGLEAVKALAHRLEDIFRALSNETVEIDTQLESLLLEAFDCLKEPLMEQIATGECDWESAISSAVPLLARIEERMGDALKMAEGYLPSSSDLGVDLVASIFEVDVAEGLDRLAKILADPVNYEVAGELRAQAEVFAGFAEMLNLPGFQAIAQTAHDALDACPEQALQIVELALNDFQAGRAAVLGGDRHRGGEPSAALVEFARTPVQNEAEALSLEELLTSTEDGSALTMQMPALETFAIDPTSLEPKLELAKPSQNKNSNPVAAVIPFPSPSPSNSVNPSSANISVRVDLNRLEQMNNLVGELVINRNSLSLQNEHLQQIVRGLSDKYAQFQNIISKYEDLSHKTRLKQKRDRQLKEIAQEPMTRHNDFEALELDSYEKIYSLTQGVLEEMMQLKEAIEDATLVARQSHQSIAHQRQTLNSLKDELMWARMLPIGEVFNRFPRGLRDLSVKYNKPVNLKLSGTEVLVDKGIIEKLHDPLLHLLRNAFDHGIEPPQMRRQVGKPEEGQIEIRAYHKGNQTIIEIGDDGRGLNFEKIGQKALQRGWITPEALAAMPKERLAEFIFEPEFSTASQVSELSGRGVGLDVVRSQLQAFKGTVAVTSSPGRGTTFTLRLPLTLTITKLLICMVGSTALALPSDTIEEVVIPKADQTEELETQRLLCWREQQIPIYRLADLLDYGCSLPKMPPNKSLFVAPSTASPMLVIRAEEQFFALEIDRLGPEQELTIKPFGSAIAPPRYTYGCTIWGDGSLLPVIDGAALLEYVQEERATATAIASKPSATPAPTVLVVDDSITVRQMLAISLEKAGYRVLQARDGWEALEQLRSGSRVQLILSDVEMPKMNGFEFLGECRQDPALAKIPIAMLTSRSNPKHRELAIRLGAAVYLTKPFIEQEFLDAIANLIGQSHWAERAIRRHAA